MEDERRQKIDYLWREARRLERQLKALEEQPRPGLMESTRIWRLKVLIAALDCYRRSLYYNH